MFEPPTLPTTRRGILAGVCVLPLLTAATHISGRTQFDEAYPNAEMFTGAVVVRDLLHGGSLDDWVLPEATYIVPDWLIWFGLEGADISPGISVWLFGVIQLTMLLALWVGIGRHGPLGLDHPGVFLAPFLLWLIIMSGAAPAAFALVSYWRFGTVLLTFAAILLTLEIFATDDRRRQIPLAVVLALTIAAGHVSDEAIAAWFSLPAAVALAIIVRAQVFRRAGAGLWVLAVGGGHLVGLAIEPDVGIRLSNYQAWITPAAIPDRFIEFLRVYNAEFGHSPTATAVVVVGLIISGYRLRAGYLGPVEQFLAYYLLAAAAVAVGAQLMLGGSSPLGPRMVTHVVVLSILCVGYTTASMMRLATIPRGLTLVALLMIGFMVIGRITPHRPSDVALEVEFFDITCVTEALEPHAGRQGLASFASLHAIIFYTDLDLQISNARDVDTTRVAPIEGPHNITWRTHDPAFVIADDWSYQSDPWPTLTADPTVMTFGEPTEIVDCTRWQVLLYD